MDDVPLASLDDRLRDRVLAATAGAQHRLIRTARNGFTVDALTGDRVVHMMLELRSDGSVAEATESFRRTDVNVVRPGPDGKSVVEFSDGAKQSSVPMATGVAERLDWPGPGQADNYADLFASLDSPMFVVTTAAGEERAGCVVAFITQASIDPPRVAVCLSDKNRTTEVAARATHLAVHFLGQSNLDLARLFGEETGDETDKFAAHPWYPGPSGVPILHGTNGWVVLHLLDRTRGGDHIIHLGEIESAHQERHDAPVRYRQIQDFHAGHAP